jgi:hypothetical protein
MRLQPEKEDHALLGIKDTQKKAETFVEKCMKEKGMTKMQAINAYGDYTEKLAALTNKEFLNMVTRDTENEIIQREIQEEIRRLLVTKYMKI